MRPCTQSFEPLCGFGRGYIPLLRDRQLSHDIRVVDTTTLYISQQPQTLAPAMSRPANSSGASSASTLTETIPYIHETADSFSCTLPPRPNPSADAGLVMTSTGEYSPPPSPSSLDVFTIGPITALKLLCAGIEALVRITGDIPPTPPPTMDIQPNMRGMQAEKENIARSNSFKNLAELNQRPRTPSGSSASSDDIDGVRFRKTPIGSPEIAPIEPYIVIGDNAEPLNVQHSAITRKFYSKHPPPISGRLLDAHTQVLSDVYGCVSSNKLLHPQAGSGRTGNPSDSSKQSQATTCRSPSRDKALEDLSYPHSRFAKVGGVSETELARLEISFCFLTNFEFRTSKEKLIQHAISLKEIQSLQGSVNFVPRMPLKVRRRSNVMVQD